MGIAINIIVNETVLRKAPDKVEVIKMGYKGAMQTAITGWLIISVGLFLINYFTKAPV